VTSPSGSAVAALRDIHNRVVCSRPKTISNDYQAGYNAAMNDIAEAIQRYARAMYDATIEE
jgi:hypothetical protein